MIQTIINVLTVVVLACLVRVVMAWSMAIFKWHKRNWKFLNFVKVTLLAIYEALKVITWVPYHLFQTVEQAEVAYVAGTASQPSASVFEGRGRAKADVLTISAVFTGVTLTIMSWAGWNQKVALIAAIIGLIAATIVWAAGIRRYNQEIDAGEAPLVIDFRPVFGVLVLILTILILAYAF